MKEILINGGHISHSYKASKTSWISEAKIGLITGYWGSKPKVVIQSEINGWTEFNIDQIDDAIKYYESIVFNKKNLWYKVPEIQLELHRKGIKFDMELDKDYNKIMRLRNKKLKENGSNITSIR